MTQPIHVAMIILDYQHPVLWGNQITRYRHVMSVQELQEIIQLDTVITTSG